jgi:hypothetical protein
MVQTAKTNLKLSLKDKKILALSDTGYPYPYIKEFCKEISESIVDVYVSPASTSRFLKVYISFSGNKRTKILKDKKFALFTKIKPKDYIVVIFFGAKHTSQTKLLTVIAQQLIIQNYNVITVNENGVDYDEDNPIFTQS